MIIAFSMMTPGYSPNAETNRSEKGVASFIPSLNPMKVVVKSSGFIATFTTRAKAKRT